MTKKMSNSQIKTLMDLKLGLENQLEEFKGIVVETEDKKFNKKVSKLRDRVIGNVNGYNGLLDKLANEGYEVKEYLYIGDVKGVVSY